MAGPRPGNLSSRCEFQGLTRLMHGLEEGKVRLKVGITHLTRETGEAVLEKYVENLSGAEPSTAAKPLPVGVRTGTLRDGAELRQVNQYRADVKNEVYYSGFIENGTVHMAPRRPLKDAVEKVSAELPGEMRDVIVEVWRV